MLPILLSIPHGGDGVPRELERRICLSKQELFDDGDAYTREIYDLSSKVRRVIAASLARTFIDLNRAPDDRPPANPDGVIKSTTCFGAPVYAAGAEPDEDLTALLLNRYHQTFHDEVREALIGSGLRLALDCHSMAAHAPPISPDPGSARPLFCLSNAEGLTCSNSLLEQLADAIAAAFECDRSEVKLNDPFKGGYIIRTHSHFSTPWIQVEMNRSLYLEAPWFDRRSLKVDPARLDFLRAAFLKALGKLRF